MSIACSKEVPDHAGGWPGLNGVESVDMGDAERISLRQLSWK
jgi:hypothetical protein